MCVDKGGGADVQIDAVLAQLVAGLDDLKNLGFRLELRERLAPEALNLASSVASYLVHCAAYALGGFSYGLGGEARGPAKRALFLDNGHALAELRRAHRAGLPGRAAANDNEVVGLRGYSGEGCLLQVWQQHRPLKLGVQ